jgi:hypothetical protein
MNRITNKKINFDLHKQKAMLYTEESFNERGIEPPFIKAQTKRLSITQRMSSYFLT